MDSIRIFGYKSFKKLSVQLHPINLLIGANGAGKSNFLSLFEMLGNIYEKRLGAYVAQVGGVDKLLYQGRKVTDRIAVNLLIAKSEYDLALLESDGKLIVEREVVRCYDDVCPLDLVRKSVITEYQSESSLKDHKEEDLSNYISQIRKFHFHDTGRRSPFTADSHIVNDAYRMYEHGENLAAILYRIQREKPMAYRRIIRVIQSVAPYFSDFYFQPTEADMVRLQWQDKYSSTCWRN